ncbi:MAG: hypothetical protein ABW321_03645 [Polyangiales bacterium]
MTVLALPILGVLFVFGVVLPAAALGSRAALRGMRRHAADAGLHGHGALRYLLLVGPTALPLAWIIAACMHQAEAGTDPSVCMLPDEPGVLCPEVAGFACALVLLVLLTGLPRVIREQRALRSATSPLATQTRARLDAMARMWPDLGVLIARMVVVDDNSADPIATRGVFAPRVVVCARFVAALDDAALIGALRHEAEHVRDRDPLRYFLAWWALAVNPLGRALLAPELARWIATREVHCDREAVLSGAAAPALAQALVSAARFPHALPAEATGSALHAADREVLRLRVELLMAYSEREPARCCQRVPVLRLAAACMVLATALAHQFGDGPLDTLHRATESAASFVTEE